MRVELGCHVLRIAPQRLVHVHCDGIPEAEQCVGQPTSEDGAPCCKPRVRRRHLKINCKS